MADDETQGSIDTSWGASDASPDLQLPSMGFDEPLLWPESPVWDDIAGPPAAGHEGEFFFPLAADLAPAGPMAEFDAAPGAEIFAAPASEAGAAPAVEAARPPDSDDQWRPAGDPVDPDATQIAGPLAALGGGSGPVPSESGGNVPWPDTLQPSSPERPVEEVPVAEPALGSIWSNERRDDPQNLVGLGGVAAPAIYADTDRNSGSMRWRRLDVRPGNAAVIGLISVVSLILLGMFLSVRARNDVPTDASQPRTAANDITVTGPLNTTPQTTAATSTTTTAPPAINLSELAQTTETTTAAATTGSSASATTTPTTRSAAPTATATTTPTTQPTVTTEAPPATTEVTSAPVSNTTPTTSRPTPTFTIPPFTIPTGPSYTIPDNFGRLPGFGSRDN